MSNFSPNQTVSKKIVRSEGGVVAAQHVGAAAIGARVLAEGGNAMDAAVATSFALGVIEPWMSGIGGGGMMVVRHPDGAVNSVDFGMHTAAGLRPEDYPLEEGEAEGLFAWPAVKGNRNMTGPLAIAVPGAVDGVGTAHAVWGRKPWEELVAPAVDLAWAGLSVDWYATMVIGQAAHSLRNYDATREWFLPDGAPPAVPLTPRGVSRLTAPRLAGTLETIMREGPRSFYEGPLAARIAADARAMGSDLNVDDLSGYHARILNPLAIEHRNTRIWAMPELSAGPTLAHVLREHAATSANVKEPDADWYLSMANALKTAYEARLSKMGDVDGARDIGCTSHFSVVDRDGMVVSQTQTLLSVFGSMVTFPQSGVLMNNGVFWFDPRPGRPNSLAPGKRCLSNMCPIVLERPDGGVFGLGASGGRRIMPAVAQLATFVAEFGMELEQALHHPRIDMSGSSVLIADKKLDAPTLAALSGQFDVHLTNRTVFPSWFANISAVQVDGTDRVGGSEPCLPWSDAVPASNS